MTPRGDSIDHCWANVPLDFENGKEKESEKKVEKLYGFNACPLYR
jgi:hypothetical protein